MTSEPTFERALPPTGAGESEPTTPGTVKAAGERRFPRPFGRYTLLRPLAEGGMGALYLGFQGEAGMEKLCVIKTVLPHLADKEYVARFRDEAKVVVRLSHGNLVPVFDAGVARTDLGEELYLAMEYVDGKDLRAVWNRCAKKGIAFPVDVAAYIARELARGLYHAHTAGAIKLVHRDVSPPNVLVSFSGEVKLTDFGLAASTLKTERTAPGVIYGKVSYMSPEQARGEPLDGRTDLYAVAIILWELLTGRQLFPQGEANLILKVRDPAVPAPSSLTQRVPPALDAIVMKALAKDKTLRYPDGEAFRAALSGFLAQHAPTTDNDRVARFLEQLFGDEIQRDRDERQALLEQVAEERARRAQKATVPAESSQLASKPETVSLGPSSPPPPGAGDLIGNYLDGRYLVKRLIGEGGMGLVYEAEHVEIGRRVAVKVLHAMYTRQPEVVARFRAEARAATRIGHPHIIEVLDSGTTVDGAVYFVMEFLAGQTLAELIAKAGPLSQKRAVVIAREVCQALAAAHKAGIIHRDMKPENVFLLEREGHADFVKVLDFGIAKTLDHASERVGRLTSPGVAMGTPEYMAPEQAAGMPTDHRVDVYAVGAMLYEMLTGRVPHEGGNVMEILTKKATLPASPVGQLRPDLHREVERLIMRALSSDPAARPQTMEELAGELGRLVGIDAATARAEGGSGRAAVPAARAVEGTDRVRRSRTPLFVGAAAAAALATVGIGLGISRWQKSETPRTAPLREPAREPLRAQSLPAQSSRTQPSAAAPEAAAPAPALPAATGMGAPTAGAAAPVGATAVSGVTARRTPAAAKDARPKTPEKASAPAVAEKASPEGKRLLGEARQALAEKHLAQAEVLFNQALATGGAGERGAALTGLGEVAFARGNYAEAARLAQRGGASGGGTKARLLFANASFRLKKYDDAIAAYRDVLKVDKHQPEATANLAAAERLKTAGP